MTLSSTKREELYNAEKAKAEAAGLGSLPVCNICGTPVDGMRQRWDESHDPQKPRWLGGAVTGIAHERCNRQHNNDHDTPLFHKNNRQRQKANGSFRPRSRIAGSRSDPRKIKMDRTVVDRFSGERIQSRPWVREV